jgi:hypothetical protein
VTLRRSSNVPDSPSRYKRCQWSVGVASLLASCWRAVNDDPATYSRCNPHSWIGVREERRRAPRQSKRGARVEFFWKNLGDLRELGVETVSASSSHCILRSRRSEAAESLRRSKRRARRARGEFFWKNLCDLRELGVETGSASSSHFILRSGMQRGCGGR